MINRFLAAIGAKRYKTYRIYRRSISPRHSLGRRQIANAPRPRRRCWRIREARLPSIPATSRAAYCSGMIHRQRSLSRQ